MEEIAREVINELGNGGIVNETWTRDQFGSTADHHKSQSVNSSLVTPVSLCCPA